MACGQDRGHTKESCLKGISSEMTFKFNLTNRFRRKETMTIVDLAEYLTESEQWFEGFEKELRELHKVYDKSGSPKHLLVLIEDILGEEP